jgi:DNA-binding CsgD family transcriptional regulator
MGPVDPADITVADARALIGGATALHDISDLGAMDSALRHWTADLIPYDAMDLLGAITVGRTQRTATVLDHRLAIRTTGGGAVLVGVVLGRTRRAFTAREAALAALLGPLLGVAVDHVRLRAAHREQLAALAVLTDREREVLALVADGRTNRDIADALYIEARTVEKHVEHIRMKLGARSRAEAAACWARATA